MPADPPADFVRKGAEMHHRPRGLQEAMRVDARELGTPEAQVDGGRAVLERAVRVVERGSGVAENGNPAPAQTLEIDRAIGVVVSVRRQSSEMKLGTRQSPPPA